jgi:hypothetical protein
VISICAIGMLVNQPGKSGTVGTKDIVGRVVELDQLRVREQPLYRAQSSFSTRTLLPLRTTNSTTRWFTGDPRQRPSSNRCETSKGHTLGIGDQSNRDATAKLIEYLRDREILRHAPSRHARRSAASQSLLGGPQWPRG